MKPLSQRFREITEAPERLERMTQDVGKVMILTLLIALLALSVSAVALREANRAH